jgi:hypothetical protein
MDMTQVLPRSGEVLLEIDGTFDAIVAWDVRRRLRALPPDAHVVLDFTRVKEFLDLGVAVVAPWLVEHGHPRVTLRGLRQHQRRMFRYFGVDLDATVSRAVAGAVATARDGLDIVL